LGRGDEGEGVEEVKASEAKQKVRKTYRKPTLRVVELAAREVLGLGCKTDGGGRNLGVSPCNVGVCSGVDVS